MWLNCAVLEISRDSIINEEEYLIAATIVGLLVVYHRYIISVLLQLLSGLYPTVATKLQSQPLKGNHGVVNPYFLFFIFF